MVVKIIIVTSLGVTVYIENNSIIDTINYKPDDLKIIFDRNPKAELLLDIAHIDSYEHLKEIINIKYPKCLHIADKHFSAKHEHLPIGEGDLDFELIFSQHLSNLEGRIILEVIGDNAVITNSKDKILKAILSAK
ncbi:hypothetical protein SDC9_212104 [bioreactor metagenome]|uniref:Xylose isomerase-like TIM barrel domain-containing protein n=1 Tax=bioreactor metagenome TaxID=1076179 RepID=A0A645JM17_9ZZZZ